MPGKTAPLDPTQRRRGKRQRPRPCCPAAAALTSVSDYGLLRRKNAGISKPTSSNLRRAHRRACRLAGLGIRACPLRLGMHRRLLPLRRGAAAALRPAAKPENGFKDAGARAVPQPSAAAPAPRPRASRGAMRGAGAGAGGAGGIGAAAICSPYSEVLRCHGRHRLWRATVATGGSGT